MDEAPPDEGMSTTRLEAFSDGVMAVIITIMVLELKPPTPPTLKGLTHEAPVFFAYVVSFLIVAVYWVDHHHLMAAARRVTAATLWRNIFWLFWLSLYPFLTNFVSASSGSPTALALYGGLGAITALAWGLLGRDIGTRNRDVGAFVDLKSFARLKNATAVGINLAAIPVAFVSRPLAVLLLVLPPLSYFMPSRRLETSE